MRSLRLLVAAVVCLVALPASSALAARKGSVRPVISSVGPASLSVGDTLTIRGRNFLAGAKRNTVIFKRDRGRPVSVKAGTATRTVIKVVVPESLGVAEPTRFRVRIRARAYSRGYTAPKRSVLIGPLADLLDDAACAAGDVADGLGELTGVDPLGDVVDDLLAADGCDGDPGADPADAGPDSYGDDPAADEPVDAGGAPDPWDVLPTA
jgi:hypothetical protein